MGTLHQVVGTSESRLSPLAAGATCGSDTEAGSLGAELREGKGAACGIVELRAEQQGKPRAPVHD